MSKKNSAKRTRRIIRNYLRAAMAFTSMLTPTGKAKAGPEVIEQLREKLDRADALLATLPGYRASKGAR